MRESVVWKLRRPVSRVHEHECNVQVLFNRHADETNQNSSESDPWARESDQPVVKDRLG